jgi:cytochrome c
MKTAITLALATTAITSVAAAEPDAEHGRQLFGRACAACHSLTDENMTGPSLAGIWNRKAGAVASFRRYSPALKEAGVTWTGEALDAWLTDPSAFIPGNHMIFPGIDEAAARADLLAFLKQASEGAADMAQADDSMGGMMGMGAAVPNLKTLPPSGQVTRVEYCPDTYSVSTADGETTQFWERNLRFKTDSSEDGPRPGAPAIVGAGMMGDRASVIFAAPEEFAAFIKRTC